MKNLRRLEPRTVVLLLALAIGLGLAVHFAFFVAALALVIVGAAQEAVEHGKLMARHA